MGHLFRVLTLHEKAPGRILILPTEYPEPAKPGVIQGVWAREQARALSRRFEVAVLYATSDRRSISYEGRDGDVLTRIIAYRHWRKTWLLSGLVATWRALRSLHFQPDCIHAHGLYPAGLYGILIGRALRVPVVATEHWGPLEERVRGSRVMRSLLAYVLRSADATIAVSKRLAAEMVALEPRSRPAVVGNTVHPSFFETPLDSPPSGGPIRVLFVGRLRDAFKGLDKLLHAVGRVRATQGQARVQLTVVGDGVLKSELERLAAVVAGGSVEFLGALPAAEVPAVMSTCHVFVMPSSYETFGLVFAEAMAAGKPVIGCLGTAAEEIVPAFAGILVPPNDDDALTQALREATQHIDRFDRATIRAYAREHFSYQAFVDALQRVYDGVLTPGTKERAGTSKDR